jgi:2',3'-cyclic-nucleotide 2'-phosphodiesterase (5'-nucleotidase family)
MDGSNSQLVFLHTANINPGNYRVIKFIKEIKNNNANAILLKAGPNEQEETGRLTYDASINGTNDVFSMTGDYKIINKGNLRTGIISANPGESNVIEKVNTLSAYLKKERNCTIVVCLSGLGYKNKNAPDDISMAKKSKHLDIIIGGHAKNFPTNPIIALNNKDEEVIIHSASGDLFTCGIIKIDFDGQGRKKYIGFTDQPSKNTAPHRTMPAA